MSCWHSEILSIGRLRQVWQSRLETPCHSALAICGRIDHLSRSWPLFLRPQISDLRPCLSLSDALSYRHPATPDHPVRPDFLSYSSCITAWPPDMFHPGSHFPRYCYPPFWLQSRVLESFPRQRFHFLEIFLRFVQKFSWSREFTQREFCTDTDFKKSVKIR